MTMATKKDIFEEHLQAWLHAEGDRKKRREIRQNICFVSGVPPKSVPRSFRRVQLRGKAAAEHRGRPTIYTPDVTAALKELWEIGGEPGGGKLHPLIGEYVTVLKRDGLWRHGDEATQKVLTISLGTVKACVAHFKRLLFPSKGKSTTLPGAIHVLIPVRSGPWDEAPTGTMQLDTVAHCGGSVAGDYVFTVNAADVATLWG